MTREDQLDAGVIADRLLQAERRSRRLFAAVLFLVLAVFLVIFYEQIVSRAIFAYKEGVSFNNVDFARSQLALWKKNLPCIKERQSTTELADRSIVNVKVCPSTGDLFIWVQAPDGQSYERWIPFNSLSEVK